MQRERNKEGGERELVAADSLTLSSKDKHLTKY